MFERGEGVEHGVMLDGGGYDVAFSLTRSGARRAHERPVVRLSAAGGEVYLPRIRSKCRGDLPPRIQQCRHGALPHAVLAGHIGVVILQRGGHRGERRG